MKLKWMAASNHRILSRHKYWLAAWWVAEKENRRIGTMIYRVVPNENNKGERNVESR